MAMRDQLFLMRPGFSIENRGPFYCGDSVSVEGLLSFFPKLRSVIDVHYVDFERPRRPIAEWLGEENQSVPVLVLADEAAAMATDIEIREARGRRFISKERMIRAYMSSRWTLPVAS